MKEKLTSRKFWICVAAFLASIATSIAGLVNANQTITIVGTVAGILSAAIYAFCEAWVDGKAVGNNGEELVEDEKEIGFKGN
jgi:hypothetical protein